MAVAEKVTVELELKDQQYNARLKSSEREFKRSMDATERAAENTARDIDRTLGQLPDSLKAKYRELGTDIGRSMAGISRAAGLAFGALTAYSLKLASDAGEIESAFGVAFGSATADVKAFSEQLGDTAGRDSVVLRESMTRLQLVLTGTGVEAKKAAELVKTLAAAGVDAGSLFNTSDAEALQKIISGLTGESEPLKAFGVVLTEAAVKAELLRLGFKGNVDAASEAAKSIARANLILKGLNVAQGDAARTADSAANTTKRMTAEFNKAAREVGQELLPVMTKLFGAATDVLRAFNDLPGGVQVAGLAFLGLIAAGGPIAGLIANLSRLRALAIATGAAIAAMGGGAGAGAAAGAGARGLIAGGVAGAAGLGGGLLLSQGSFAPAPNRTAEIVERNLANTIRLRPNDTKTINGLRRELEGLRLRSRLAEIGNGTGAYAEAVSGSTPGVVGGFGLGDLANGTASGGRSGGRGGAAGLSKAARDLERLRSDLARVQDAQLTDAERAAKDLAETIAIINAAAAGGLITDAQALALNRGASTQDITMPTGADYDIDPLIERAQELGDAIAEGFAEQRQEFADKGAMMGRAFTDILTSGDIFESLGRTFANAAAGNLEKLLSQVFTAIFANQGQGASILNTIGSSIFGFGGGRASGGPVRAGFSYDVGESGREKFVAPTNGFIIPNMGVQARSAGAQKIEVKQTFDLTGVSGDQAIYSNVSRMIKQGQAETVSIINRAAPGAQRQRALLKD